MVDIANYKMTQIFIFRQSYRKDLFILAKMLFSCKKDYVDFQRANLFSLISFNFQ